MIETTKVPAEVVLTRVVPDPRPPEATDPEEARRAELQRRADRLRERVALTLGELSRRRERVLDWAPVRRARAFLEHSKIPLEFAAGLGAGLAVAGGLYLIGSSIGGLIDRRRHPYRQRLLALQRAWEHPERLAR